MNFLSVCSGIESASVAWEPLGWRPVGYAEIDDYCRALLNHYYPEVPLHGDFTQIRKDDVDAADLLVGGTPCQGFSIAGLREGLGDPRSNLALGYCVLADRLRARWLAWENVPGAFSTPTGSPGEDFRSFVSALARWDVPIPKGGWQNSGIIEPGPVDGAYGLAWRVCDSQYIRVDGLEYAVPQRRRRIILVGYLGDWRRAAAVLFDTQSLRRDPPPRRRSGQGVAGTLIAGAGKRGQPEIENGQLIPEVANPLTARMHKGVNTTMDEGQTMVAFDRQQITHPENRSSARGDTAGAMTGEPPTIAFCANDSGEDAAENVSPTLRPGGHSKSHANGGVPPAVAYAIQGAAGRENPKSGPDGVGVRDDGAAYTLEARSEVQSVVTLTVRGRGDHRNLEINSEGAANAILTPNGGRDGMGVGAVAIPAQDWAVRRLTPRECDRLQGFEDDYTLVPFGKGMAADSRRYKALGNSMSVNTMRWLGTRIQMVDELDHIFRGNA